MEIPGIVELAASALLAAASLGPSVASAHHSVVMFEPKKTMTLEGVVKEFQYTNPHSWLQLITTDQKGGHVEWSLEMGPSVGLFRAGWRPRLLKPGDKVTVSFHPLKNGQNGGRLVSVTLPDGRLMNGQGGRPLPQSGQAN